MKIDFVSDIACPWCAVGFASLEIALARLGPETPVEIRFQPFELNPYMPPDGEDVVEHLTRKYGATPERLAQSRAVLRERGLAVGFVLSERNRVWNTFDAHRLLHWAGLQGKQWELKHALLKAYHTNGENPGDIDVLARLAAEAGLNPETAREVVLSGAYAADVRLQEKHFQQLGIHSVPSVIVNDRHLIQGGQPPEVFEQALRQIAAEVDNAPAN